MSHIILIITTSRVLTLKSQECRSYCMRMHSQFEKKTSSNPKKKDVLLHSAHLLMANRQTPVTDVAYNRACSSNSSNKVWLIRNAQHKQRLANQLTSGCKTPGSEPNPNLGNSNQALQPLLLAPHPLT